MAKRPFNIEEVPHEDHYSRKITESTQKGIDELITLSKSAARKIHKKIKEYQFMLEGEYYKRREAAIRHTLDSVMHRYTLTERTNGLFPTAEQWINFNMLNCTPLEDIEAQTSIILAAALWILDHVSNRIQLQQLISKAPCACDPDLPAFCDMAHESDVVEAVVEILMHRYAGEHCILDVTESPGDTFDLFHQLIGLLNPKELQKIAAEARLFLWATVDEFFKIEYPFADYVANVIKEYDETVDGLNADAQRLRKAISDEKKANAQLKESLKKASKKPSNVAEQGKINAGGFAGPFAAPPKAPFAAPFALPKQTARFSPTGYTSMPLSLSPFQRNMPLSANPNVSPLDALLTNGEQASDLVINLLGTLQEQSNRLDDLHQEIQDTNVDMARLGLDYSVGGFTYKERYATRYTRVKLQIPSYTYSDPYRLCFGILLLCSPTVIRKLFDGVNIVAFNADYDLTRGADFTARQKINKSEEKEQSSEAQSYDAHPLSYLSENFLSPNCGDFSAYLVQRNAYTSSYFGTIDSYLDLPWLSGLISGFTADVAWHLPWGMQPYDEDSF